MRAGSQSGCRIEVEVVETSILNKEILGSWSDDSMGTSPVKSLLSIGSFSNDERVVYSSHEVSKLSSKRELNTSQKIISGLELMESDVSNLLCNSSVSSILPTSQSVEIGSDWWILPEWVRSIESIV